MILTFRGQRWQLFKVFRPNQTKIVVLKNSPSCVLITSNNAEDYPDILRFDRVLCDVPCTGDGTIRKNPVFFNLLKPA
jgi:16S rRNA C967 or C1407 C5-methylase (RsmB/RsmF family)